MILTAVFRMMGMMQRDRGRALEEMKPPVPESKPERTRG